MQRLLPRITIYHTVVIPAAALGLFAAMLFLRYTTEIQTQELKFTLNALAARENAVDAADLLVRLNAELSQNKFVSSRQRLPLKELQNLAAFGEHVGPDEAAMADNASAQWTRRLITVIQRLAGIDPPSHIYSANGVDLLTLGYNLERRRFFAEALVTFRKVLGNPESAEVENFARLHAGYCLFFLGEYSLVRDEWQMAQKNGTAQNQKLASRLLAWLDAFEGRRSVAARQVNSRRRAEALFEILAYKESLEALLAVAERGRDPQYYYLKGRVYEGPGKFEAAAEEYARTLALAPKSEVAQLANRRLLLMGTLYRNDKRLAEAATKRAEIFGDTSFLAALARVRDGKLAPEESLTSAAIYRQILATQKAPPVAPVVRIVRIRTHDGAVITGRLSGSDATHVVLINDNGRLRIPKADILSQENVSGN